MIAMASTTLSTSLAMVRPELFLAIGAMALLMVGVYGTEKMVKSIGYLSVLVLVATLVLVVGGEGSSDGVLAFGGSISIEPFAIFAKIIVLAASAIAIIMSLDYVREEKMDRFEYPVLMILATLGMMIMISANDLITLYMGLELQSLALYVLASFKRDSQRSTEAGLKYFVLGALSSGLLLYGASLIYGFSGTVNFDTLADLVRGDLETSTQIGLIFGMTFLLAGLAFKISAVPFHMWTPDVYEGSPTPITAFFAAAPKVAAMALIIRVTVGAFPVQDGASAPWQQILIFVSVASMLLGAFAAIGQTNIKRLMAYSSIGHMGYALAGLSVGTEHGVRGVLLYMLIYVVMTIGTFVCILSMRRREGMVENISDLSGLKENHPIMAFTLSMLMFSLAGIPPMAGFFGKWFVFVAVVESGMYWLAVVALLASVVSAFYYIRIVKVIYFDEPVPAFESPMPVQMRTILTASGVFTILFILFGRLPLEWAGHAAASLF